MKYFEKHSSPYYFICGLLTVILPSIILSMLLNPKQSLDIELANLLTQVVVAASASLAFIAYYENKEEKKLKHAVNLINFFREKILSTQGQVTNLILNEKGKDYVVPRIVNFDTSNMTINSIYPDSESKRLLHEFLGIKSIDNLHTHLLNCVEEFALRIRVYGLVDHQALHPVYDAFVQIIEQGGIHKILQHRVIGTGANVFTETLNLYDIWKGKVSRQTEEERMDSFFTK